MFFASKSVTFAASAFTVDVLIFEALRLAIFEVPTVSVVISAESAVTVPVFTF